MNPIARLLLGVLGGIWLAMMTIAWLIDAHAGYVNAFAIGLFAAAGWAMLATGALGGLEPTTRRGVARTGALLIVVGFATAGPSTSAGYVRGVEGRAYAALEDDDTDLEAWRLSYEKIAPSFRRDGWEAAWFRARVERAVSSGDRAAVQRIVDEIDRIGGPGSGAARATATRFLDAGDGNPASSR